MRETSFCDFWFFWAVSMLLLTISHVLPLTGASRPSIKACSAFLSRHNCQQGTVTKNKPHETHLLFSSVDFFLALYSVYQSSRAFLASCWMAIDFSRDVLSLASRSSSRLRRHSLSHKGQRC